MEQWGVLDRHMFSDHKYIYFKVDITYRRAKDYFLKTSYNMDGFLRGFSREMKTFETLLEEIKTTDDIDNYYSTLIETTKDIVLKSFRKKPRKRYRGFMFWNDDLRALRNTTNKLYKIYKRLKDANSPETVVQAAGNNYRKSRTEYKRTLLSTKRTAWENYCKTYRNTYG
ncbi:hypothetical protein AVEN_159146-1 [Araneus ventricosus]|uniref:Endonuclease/exonuclease/phosphatase domain-containing protein n=1 Tax=Araneus ventricosus TaxID=182803 RepID=A0A4Y2VZR5_ARAVE|nr:hypothetical protein AVEN_159146-1 [Araneus ventricosus]